MNRASYAWVVNVVGWLILAIALICLALHELGRANGLPFDPAEGTGIIGLAALGVAVSAIARSLKRIEARLTILETDRTHD